MLLGNSAEPYRWFLYPQEAQTWLRGTATTPPTAPPFTPKSYNPPLACCSVWNSAVQPGSKQTSDQVQERKQTSDQVQERKQMFDQVQERKQTSDQVQERKQTFDQVQERKQTSDQVEESVPVLVRDGCSPEMYHNRTQSQQYVAMATANASVCFHCPPKCILKPTMEVGPSSCTIHPLASPGLSLHPTGH